MGWWISRREIVDRLFNLETRQRLVERRTERMEKLMAKDKDALAALDKELQELADYVRSDEDSDAAEIQKRTDKVKQLLADVKADPNVPDDEGATREQELAQVQAEADQQAQNK
jgi:hypothetical protein